jgi:hypothetical protein
VRTLCGSIFLRSRPFYRNSHQVCLCESHECTIPLPDKAWTCNGALTATGIVRAQWPTRAAPRVLRLPLGPWGFSPINNWTHSEHIRAFFPRAVVYPFVGLARSIPEGTSISVGKLHGPRPTPISGRTEKSRRSNYGLNVLAFFRSDKPTRYGNDLRSRLHASPLAQTHPLRFVTAIRTNGITEGERARLSSSRSGSDVLGGVLTLRTSRGCRPVPLVCVANCFSGWDWLTR